MIKNIANNKNLFFSSLQKYIIASTLLGLTIILELAYDNLGIVKLDNGVGTFVKISILPLILIGFLLGFKHSFIFCSMYACFHLYKAIFLSYNILAYMKELGFDFYKQLTSLLLDYVLVDLTYSLSALFYFHNLKYFSNYKRICFNLLIVFIFVLFCKFCSSRFIWYDVIKKKTISRFFSLSLFDNANIWCLCYNLVPVLTTFLLSVIFFSFLNPRMHIYLNSHK